jgi:hypothetical protein
MTRKGLPAASSFQDREEKATTRRIQADRIMTPDAIQFPEPAVNKLAPARL